MSHAKPVDERAGHRTAPALLASGGARVAPALPEQLRRLPDDLRERWVGLWTSPVAAVLDPVSDLEPMTRLFRLYAMGRRMMEALERQIDWMEAGEPDLEFDPGFARNSLSFASEIRQLEQTLGITPRGRLVIGAAVAAQTQGQRQVVEHDDSED